jgi:hypothetical protein
MAVITHTPLRLRTGFLILRALISLLFSLREKEIAASGAGVNRVKFRLFSPILKEYEVGEAGAVREDPGQVLHQQTHQDPGGEEVGAVVLLVPAVVFQVPL